MDFVTRLGDHITYGFSEFADFVETLPLQGLGAGLTIVERLIGPRPDLLAILYELTPPPGAGRPKILNEYRIPPPPPRRPTPLPRCLLLAGRHRPATTSRTSCASLPGTGRICWRR